MRYFDASEAVRTGRESASATSDALEGSWPFSVPLPTTQRVCCRSAHPHVTVILPPASPGGEPIDLLRYGHHLRSSQSSLNAAEAVAFDARGQRVPLTNEAA